jgi:SAM-dependent methyltransferase
VTLVDAVLCPACGGGATQIIRHHRAPAAAEHFVPKARDAERHAQLVRHLEDVLWKQDHADIRRCDRCGFGFCVPWVSGDPEFYALVHQGDPHYPRDRWEFGQTRAALAPRPKPLRIAEVGAGAGAFLDGLDDGCEIVAGDYDQGAVARLRETGYDAFLGSLPELVARETVPFDAVCMFQTLEHIADIDGAFAALTAILKPGGSVFVSVPNAEATDFQEAATGLWDMPPNHVGRWTPAALRLASERRGFGVAELKLEPIKPLRITWQLAVSSVNARSYRPGSLESRINSIGARPVRGMAKRLPAIARVPSLLSRQGSYRSLTFWARLEMRP